MKNAPLYVVLNDTDGTHAAPSPMTAAVALQFMLEFRRIYRRQGFYRTVRGTNIDPNQVQLRMEPYNGN